jgi:hypothetical protein
MSDQSAILEIPQEETLNQDITQEETPQEQTLNQDISQEETPQEQTLNQDISQEETPQEETLNQDITQEETPQEETLNQDISQEETPQEHILTQEILEPEPPNPIIEWMKQNSRAVLSICLNYTDSGAPLKNRTHFTQDNSAMILTEPSRENILKTLNTIIGVSSLVNEIIIYYTGYGNGINPDMSKESGVIDNLARVMVPADFTQIDIVPILANTCCKTVCILDGCPYQDEEMSLKWSVDTSNLVKIVTICESDSKNSDKQFLIDLATMS